MAPQVSAGRFHTCALRTDRTVTCWGDNTYGQATVPSGLTPVAQVSAGGAHTCALKMNGTVVCWGDNAYSQATVPSGLTAVAQVSGGIHHTCALKSDGTAVCWGFSLGATVPSGLTAVAQVSSGDDHTCALKTNGTVLCWGWNGYGQTTVPSGLTAVAQVSAGVAHTCVLKTDGTVTCWGHNPFGHLTVPSGLTAVEQVSAGGQDDCALRTDRTVTCWGENTFGEATVPSGLNSVTQVSAGGYHTCALKTSATVVCWGRNVEGQTTVPRAGYAVTAFATGFSCREQPDPFQCGLRGLALDPAGNLFVADFGGSLYKFGPAGGVASPATRLFTYSGPVYGLTFGKDGSLFASQGGNLGPDVVTVVQLNPSTGANIRTVTPQSFFAIPPAALASDPLSGDLFISNGYGEYGAIYRISSFGSGPGTVSKYASVPGADALAFGGDGTLWVTVNDNRMIWVTGTNNPQPGLIGGTIRGPAQVLATGLAVSTDPNNPVLYINRDDGVITKLDLDLVKFTDVVTGGRPGGRAAAVGPDGCVYAAQGNQVVKVSNAESPTCMAPPLGPLVVPKLNPPKPPLRPCFVGGCWVTVAAMPTPRFDLAAGVVNGVLYAVSGLDPNASPPSPLSTVEAYHP